MTPLQQLQDDYRRESARLRLAFAAAVAAEHDAGRTLEDIGREVGLTRQRIYALVRAARVAPAYVPRAPRLDDIAAAALAAESGWDRELRQAREAENR